MTLAVAEGVLVRLYEITRLTPEQIRQACRKRRISRPRQAAMYALHRRTLWSSPQIAKFLGLKDHTSVLHGIKKIEALLEAKDDIVVLVDALMEAQAVMPGITDLHIRAVDEYRELRAPAEPLPDDIEPEAVDEDDFEPSTKHGWAGIQLGSAKLLFAIQKARVSRRVAA